MFIHVQGVLFAEVFEDLVQRGGGRLDGDRGSFAQASYGDLNVGHEFVL